MSLIRKVQIDIVRQCTDGNTLRIWYAALAD